MAKFKKRKLRNILLPAALIMTLGFLNFCFAPSSVSAENPEAIVPADDAGAVFPETAYAVEETCQDDSIDFQSEEVTADDAAGPENIADQAKASENTENRAPILSCCMDKYWLTRIDNAKNDDFEDLTFDVPENNAGLGGQKSIQDAFFVPLPKAPPPKGEELATIFKKE